jgi:transposase-like protein
MDEPSGDDAACRLYLEGLRWPDGVKCPKCGSDEIFRMYTRDQFDCGAESCGYQFSVTAGTMFNDTHLSFCKWFLAVYLMCESKNGVSACQLGRSIKVAYKTGWYLCHRIRLGHDGGQSHLSAAMKGCIFKRKLPQERSPGVTRSITARVRTEGGNRNSRADSRSRAKPKTRSEDC